MHIRWYYVPICASFFLTFGGASVFAAEGPAYVSQTYIDTLIQQAYYSLNATEEISRAAPQKDAAIVEAKRIVAKLKKIAESDRNRKYILWKVGELESQIYLEEKGLLLEKDQKRLMAVNELIGPFNRELAKPRPDFTALDNMYARMKDLDATKAGELEFSIRDRRKGLSREITAAIERCVEKGDFDRAREDLAYCKNNQAFLDVSLTLYSTLTAKVQAHVSVDNEKAFILANLTKADNACGRNDLGAARAIMKTIAVRLDGIKGALYQREWDKLYFGNKKIGRAIERKEDSLVALDLVLLKNQGVGAATEFSDSVLKKWDVAPEKIGSVNYAILETAVAQKKKDDYRNKDVEALVDNQQDSGSMMEDILAAAKTKAKAKADSVRLAEEGNKHLTSVEKVRLDNMRLAEQGKEKREQKRIQENQDKAQHLLVDVYTLLEKGKRKQAQDEFKENQVFFKEYLAENPYKKLETAIKNGTTQIQK
jgi:hypothetical protein